MYLTLISLLFWTHKKKKKKFLTFLCFILVFRIFRGFYCDLKWFLIPLAIAFPLYFSKSPHMTWMQKHHLWMFSKNVIKASRYALSFFWFFFFGELTIATVFWFAFGATSSVCFHLFIIYFNGGSWLHWYLSCVFIFSACWILPDKFMVWRGSNLDKKTYHNSSKNWNSFV